MYLNFVVYISFDIFVFSLDYKKLVLYNITIYILIYYIFFLNFH